MFGLPVLLVLRGGGETRIEPVRMSSSSSGNDDEKSDAGAKTVLSESPCGSAARGGAGPHDEKHAAVRVKIRRGTKRIRPGLDRMHQGNSVWEKGVTLMESLSAERMGGKIRGSGTIMRDASIMKAQQRGKVNHYSQGWPDTAREPSSGIIQDRNVSALGGNSNQGRDITFTGEKEGGSGRRQNSNLSRRRSRIDC